LVPYGAWRVAMLASQPGTSWPVSDSTSCIDLQKEKQSRRQRAEARENEDTAWTRPLCSHAQLLQTCQITMLRVLVIETTTWPDQHGRQPIRRKPDTSCLHQPAIDII
jgi:hypothetical protein